MKVFVVKKIQKKKYEQFTCRIEEEIMKKIRNIVESNNLGSINRFINECLKFSLENIKIEIMNDK